MWADVKFASAVAAVLLAAGCGGWSSGAGGSTPTAPVTSCSLSELGDAQAAMNGGAGIMIGGVSLANTSAHRCELTGIPTMRLLTTGGRPVTGPEQRSPGGAAWQMPPWTGFPRVTLDPGDRVVAPFGWQNYCGSQQPAKAEVRWNGLVRTVRFADAAAGLCMDDSAAARFAVGRWQPVD
jgi:hypothetical protein